MTKFPSKSEIIDTHETLRSAVVKTPAIDGRDLLAGTEITLASLTLKNEMFQKSGSFKYRGAINVMLSMSESERKKGVVAFSGGNHAIAVARVAHDLGISAKVIMPETADEVRVSKCEKLGAEVFLVKERAEAPRLASSIVESEGRTLVPPFEHYRTIAATASLGYEFWRQQEDLDYVLMAIGGGGLAAGVSCAIRQFSPRCKIIGVQPRSADAMFRSRRSGHVEANEKVDTIADSLCPPQVGSLTLEACRLFLDDIVIVEEPDIKLAMVALYETFKLVVEGAAAVPLAAVLSQRIKIPSSANVGLILGGSSISISKFAHQTDL